MDRGSTIFQPIELPFYSQIISLPEDVSLDNPISLFNMYYTLEIIDQIVQKMNKKIRDTKNYSNLYVRCLDQYLTYLREIYIYFRIRVYITLYVKNEIVDYQKVKGFVPLYLISKTISRDRFEELYIRIRLASNKVKGPYKKVS